MFLRKDVSASVRTPSGSAGRKDAAAADAFQGRVLAASFSVIFGCPGMSGPWRGAGQNKRSSQGWLSASGKRMLLRNSGHRYLGAPRKTTLNSIGRSSVYEPFFLVSKVVMACLVSNWQLIGNTSHRLAPKANSLGTANPRERLLGRPQGLI